MSLLWLIYLIGVAESFASAEVAVCVVLGIVTGVLLIIRAIVLCNPNESVCEEIEEKHGAKMTKFCLIGLCSFFAVLLFGILIPTKQSAILMSAAAIGERVVESKQAEAIGQKVNLVADPSIELLTTWIKKQTIEQKQEIEKMTKNDDRNASRRDNNRRDNNNDDGDHRQ